MRILIADDSRTLRAALGDQLRAMGHTVLEAHEGAQAGGRSGHGQAILATPAGARTRSTAARTCPGVMERMHSGCAKA